MGNVPKSSKLIPQNPLAAIGLFIALVEAAFAYPVTKLSGTNQTIMVVFMVGFPVLLLICFVIIVLVKPGALYGPKDYSKEENFLQAIGRLPVMTSQVAPVQSAEPQEALVFPGRMHFTQQPNR